MWVWVWVWVILISGYGYRYGYLGMKKPGIPKMGMGMGIPEPGISNTDISQMIDSIRNEIEVVID